MGRVPVLTARCLRAMPGTRPLPQAASPAVSRASMDTRHAHNPCSSAEIDSCCSVLRGSSHASIKLLPNHHIGTDAQLHGFHFSCHNEDKASVLPVGVDMFNMVSMYECGGDGAVGGPAGALNPHALRVLNNVPHYQALLDLYIAELDLNPTRPARFDCIPEQSELHATSLMQVTGFNCVDTRPWKPEISNRVGLYHTFTRSTAKDERTHKVFLVVSGCLSEAAEEFHNLWLDSREHIKCADLLRCEELNWLRSCTHRNHNRVASEISTLFELPMRHVVDADDPARVARMLFPTTTTYKTDMRASDDSSGQHIRLVDGGCFADVSNNGILFEMFGSEGFWLFQGPRDYSDNYIYGSVFASTNEVACMPSATVRYHSLHVPSSTHNTVVVPAASVLAHAGAALPAESAAFLFPDEQFFNVIQELGFNRNDGTLNLMPLVYFER